MARRRKAALLGIALVALSSVWAGLIASPAAAGTSTSVAAPFTAPDAADIAEDAVVTSTGLTAVSAAASGEPACGTHNWYYRIYQRSSGYTLFVWSFQVEYCYLPNQYWVVFTPTDRVDRWHSWIRGNTVRGKIIAPSGIRGSLYNRIAGASFQYCPNGTCLKTFTPTMGFVYGLNGGKAWIGDVPLR